MWLLSAVSPAAFSPGAGAGVLAAHVCWPGHLGAKTAEALIVELE